MCVGVSTSQHDHQNTAHHQGEPGDHREITRNHIFMIPQRKTMRSPDGAFHLCLFPNEDTPRCFYAPDMDF